MEKKDMTAKIAAWKKKHGDVFAYEVDGKTCYLHRPGRDVIAAASVVGKEDPFKFAEIILSNCWLGGDEELRRPLFHRSVTANFADRRGQGRGNKKTLSGTEVVKGDGWLHAGNALIRSVLHMDPDTLSDEAWGFQVRMAEWVENERVRRYTPTA